MKIAIIHIIINPVSDKIGSFRLASAPLFYSGTGSFLYGN
jgi:hypothetical protein